MSREKIQLPARLKCILTSCSQEMRRIYYDSHKCTKSLGINGNHARLESENKTSRTKGTHDSRAPDDIFFFSFSIFLAPVHKMTLGISSSTCSSAFVNLEAALTVSVTISRSVTANMIWRAVHEKHNTGDTVHAVSVKILRMRSRAMACVKTMQCLC